MKLKEVTVHEGGPDHDEERQELWLTLKSDEEAADFQQKTGREVKFSVGYEAQPK